MSVFPLHEDSPICEVDRGARAVMVGLVVVELRPSSSRSIVVTSSTVVAIDSKSNISMNNRATAVVPLHVHSLILAASGCVSAMVRAVVVVELRRVLSWSSGVVNITVSFDRKSEEIL